MKRSEKQRLLRRLNLVWLDTSSTTSSGWPRTGTLNWLGSPLSDNEEEKVTRSVLLYTLDKILLVSPHPIMPFVRKSGQIPQKVLSLQQYTQLLIQPLRTRCPHWCRKPQRLRSRVRNTRADSSAPKASPSSWRQAMEAFFNTLCQLYQTFHKSGTPEMHQTLSLHLNRDLKRHHRTKSLLSQTSLNRRRALRVTRNTGLNGLKRMDMW